MKKNERVHAELVSRLKPLITKELKILQEIREEYFKLHGKTISAELCNNLLNYMVDTNLITIEYKAKKKDNIRSLYSLFRLPTHNLLPLGLEDYKQLVKDTYKEYNIYIGTVDNLTEDLIDKAISN